MLVTTVENAMRCLVNNVDKLCKWVDIVKGAINTLWTDMNDLKGKALMEEGVMYMLAKAMRAPKNTLGSIDILM